MKRILLGLAALLGSALPSTATWARVQATTSYCGDSAATCTITVTAPTAGNLLAIAAVYTGSTVGISSATGAGSWTHPSTCKAAASGFQAIDWIYSLSATAATSITVTLSATAQYIDIWFFEYSGSGPFSFDACGVDNGGTAYANPPAGSVTTTGLNDMAIALVKGDQTIASGSAVSPSPWVTPATNVSGTEGVSHALNFAATTTQALFVASAASYSVGSTIAFKDSTVAGASRKRVTAVWSHSDGSVAASTVDFIAQITNDMGTNEGHPHGVPSNYDFYSTSVITQGNTPGTSDGTPNNAMTYWGTVYIDAGGNPATNTRVNIRGCRAYWKRTSTSLWYLMPVENLPGVADYPENFQGNSTTTDSRTESDGSLSVMPASGKTSHYYGPYPRIAVPNTDVGGVVTVCEMRLILTNPAGTDDRSIAKFVGNVGADYYPSTTGSGIYNNPGVGGGKFKYITPVWRSFAFSTLSYSALSANPPPGLDLSADAP